MAVELANRRKDRMLSLAQEAVGALNASSDGKYHVLNRIAMAGFGAADRDGFRALPRGTNFTRCSH